MKSKYDMDKEIQEIDDLITEKLKTGKAVIRKSFLDENGFTYEVEETLEIPLFDGDNASREVKANIGRKIEKGKIKNETESAQSNLEQLEAIMCGVVDTLLTNFSDGKCSTSFNLNIEDVMGAISITNEMKEYILHLSIMYNSPEGLCNLCTCCPVMGTEDEIIRYLKDENAGRKLARAVNDLLKNK